MDKLKNNNPEHSLPRVFIRTFWGFNPSEASLIGFTREGDRNSFLNEHKEGDLILIYGASVGHTKTDDRGQILGFLDIERTPIRDTDRMSEEAKNWRNENGYQNRWNFALPVKRAWRCDQPVSIKELARRTFSETEGRRRGTRGVILHGEEAAAIFNLRVTPVNVYLEPSVVLENEPKSEPLARYFPSKAFPFQPNSLEISDGPRQLYLSLFSGGPNLLLTRQDFELADMDIVKLGISKNPEDRRKSLNQGFPPAAQDCGFKWVEFAVSQRIYQNFEIAVEAESQLKVIFEEKFKSLGGEFFLGEKKCMQTEFLTHTIDEDRIIRSSTPITTS